jgi:hypothetical protein
MAHFAKIGLNNKIIAVVTINDSVITDEAGIQREDLGIDYLTQLTGWAIWRRTWKDKSQRYNYASKDGTWDENAQAFIPPKVFDNFILDTNTYTWIPPIPCPDDGINYVWDDKTLQWINAELIVNNSDAN